MLTINERNEAIEKAQLLFQEPILFEASLRKAKQMLHSVFSDSEEESATSIDIEQGVSQVEMAEAYSQKIQDCLALIEQQKKHPLQNGQATSTSSLYFYPQQDLPFLPDELLNHIFNYLSIPEKLKSRLVCKRWDNIIYYNKPRENYFVLPKSINGYMLLNIKPPSSDSPALGHFFKFLNDLLKEPQAGINNLVIEQANLQLDANLQNQAKVFSRGYLYVLILSVTLAPILMITFLAEFFVNVFKNHDMHKAFIFIGMGLLSFFLLGCICLYRGKCTGAEQEVSRNIVHHPEVVYSDHFAYKTFRFFKLTSTSRETRNYLSKVANTFNSKRGHLNTLQEENAHTSIREEDIRTPLLNFSPSG